MFSSLLNGRKAGLLTDEFLGVNEFLGALVRKARRNRLPRVYMEVL